MGFPAVTAAGTMPPQRTARYQGRNMPGLQPLLRGLVVLAALLGAASASAETFPTKPLKMVVPFPPGGGNDALARLVAKHLSDSLGQQVIVDNRGGAGGII